MEAPPDVEGTADDVGTELTTQPLRPLDVKETSEAMQLYQVGLRSILDDADWQDAGGNEKFVKKSGWRKIATWFGLSVEIVRERVERDEQGDPLRASVVARAQAANGRFMDGDGHCSSSEKRFKSDKGRAKLENDLIATATTRAKNRAIADLVGMGAVSAEEVGDDAPPGPPLGPAASDKLVGTLTRALQFLFESHVTDDQLEKVVTDVVKEINAQADYVPQAAAMGVVLAVKQLREIEGGDTPTDDAEPEGEADKEKDDGSSDSDSA